MINSTKGWLFLDDTIEDTDKVYDLVKDRVKCQTITGYDETLDKVLTCQAVGYHRKGSLNLCDKHIKTTHKQWVKSTDKPNNYHYLPITT